MNTTPFGRQTYETWGYDANNLVERYTRASVVKSQNLATGCYPDALTAPRDDWRYRYAPFMEREQKRQFELSSGEYQREGLAWVYYGLGGDKKQLSVWNGVQGTWCLQNNHVFLWPVEYNSYGPMNTRIITRPADGSKETMFTDHLGSTVQVRRGVPEYAADQRAYTAYGESLEVPNDPLIGRTGYIGRETDKESDLGFYGVRQYDAGYGRFLSTDFLWQAYAAYTPYHYSRNRPLTLSDRTGLADLFDEDGTKVGSDGVDDQKQYITSKATVDGARLASGEIPIAAIIGSDDAYLLPNEEVVKQIYGHIVREAQGQSRREHGGVVSDAGTFEPNPPGPLITGSSGAEIDMTPSINATIEKGQKPQLIVHSHPNLSLDGGSSIEFDQNPSPKDIIMAGNNSAQGLVLYPVTKFAATATFFNALGGQVNTTWKTIEKIVGGSK